MKVYLASWYASRAEISKRAEELRACGIEVTSRWLEEREKADAQLSDFGEDFKIETARMDIEDVLLADTLVLNTPSPYDLGSTNISLATWGRGGRHFEAGFQYATMVLSGWLSPNRTVDRRLMIVGHKENIFYHLTRPGLIAADLSLPEILVYPDWYEAKHALLCIHRSALKGS